MTTYARLVRADEAASMFSYRGFSTRDMRVPALRPFPRKEHCSWFATMTTSHRFEGVLTEEPLGRKKSNCKQRLPHGEFWMDMNEMGLAVSLNLWWAPKSLVLFRSTIYTKVYLEFCMHCRWDAGQSIIRSTSTHVFTSVTLVGLKVAL